jgi:hypothetical protein
MILSREQFEKTLICLGRDLCSDCDMDGSEICKMKDADLYDTVKAAWEEIDRLKLQILNMQEGWKEG